MSKEKSSLRFVRPELEASGMAAKTSGTSPELSASFISRLWWLWVTPFILQGNKKTIQAPDLYNMNPCERTEHCASEWARAWEEERAKEDRPTGGTPSVLRVLLRCFGHEFFLYALWKPVWLIAVVTQVYVVRALVREAEAHTPEAYERVTWYDVALLVGGMLLSSVVQSLSQHHCFTGSQRVGMKVRAAVAMAVYDKMAEMKTVALAETTSGHMINIITNDTQKLMETCMYFHFAWHAVIELLVVCVLAVREAGWPAMGGVVVIAMLQPLQTYMGKTVGRLRRQSMKVTDARVKTLSEVLSGIRVVKYNGWTRPFLDRIESVRNAELGWLRSSAYVRSCNSTIKDTVTPLAALVTFGFYVLVNGDHSLSPSTAFTSLALFSIMVRIFAIAPTGVQNIGEAWISIQRLQKFLELSPGPGPSPSDEMAQARRAFPKAALVISQGSFSWALSPSAPPGSPEVLSLPPASAPILETTPLLGTVSPRANGIVKAMREGRNGHELVTPLMAGEETTGSESPGSDKSPDGGVQDSNETKGRSGRGGRGLPILTGIDLVVNEGETVAITGAVGSGKSSLLLAILGEMQRLEGVGCADKPVAYVPQQAWVLNDTVSANVTLRQPLDIVRYDAVMRACALDRDVERLPAGSQTEIGERGVNLSGGQKARLSLARACYSTAPLVLLDDPLAAVDAPVARHIITNVLAGLLRDRTVILVTHNRASLSVCDRVMVMESGRLQAIAPSELFERLGAIDDEPSTAVSVPAEEDSHEESLGRSKAGIAGGSEDLGEGKMARRRRGEIGEERKGGDGKMQRGRVTVTEDRVEGVVTWKTYLGYVNAGGGLGVLGALLVVFSMAQVFRVFGDLWLAELVDHRYGLQTPVYLYVYAGFVLGLPLLCLSRAMLFTNTAMRAATTLHRDMAEHVLRSPLVFFDQNPVGRILNRFSKDQSFVDAQLPATSQMMVELFMACGGTVVVVGIFIPWFLVVLPPMAVLFRHVQSRYIAVSREIKRLDAVSRSPIYEHFSQTLQGIASVRAYDALARFRARFEALIDGNHRAHILSVHASRWLGVRLDLCAAVFVTVTALCVLLLRHSLAAGLAGVVLVQSLQLTGLFQFCVRQAAEVENFMTSVERVHAYASLPVEHDIWEGNPEEVEKISPSIAAPPPPHDWPSRGEIHFDKVTLAYREDLPPVLYEITFQVSAGEKVGIVGRTGAGKSSLAACLFRMVQNSACSGRITIDGIDINSVPLDDLRQRISIIPQEPVLFAGTVRENLDPFGRHADAELDEALASVRLRSGAGALAGGLSARVAEGGENLSVGQRQLLCLARAILRRSTVVVMDEATAAVDMETEQAIVETLHESFRDCTVLTIAHRLDTVIDCDRILVLGPSGCIAEFGTPVGLLSMPKNGSLDSSFASMVAQTGPSTAARLRKAAEIAASNRRTNSGPTL